MEVGSSGPPRRTNGSYDRISFDLLLLLYVDLV